MPPIRTTPGQILGIWKSIHGPLPPGMDGDFLRSEEVQKLSYFYNGPIRQAMSSGAKNLAEVISSLEKFVSEETYRTNMRAWLHDNFKPTNDNQISNLELGSYSLSNQIYSIRKGEATERYRVYKLDTNARRFLRLKHRIDEVEIVNKLTATNRLTLARARALSDEWGLCCHCGRILTASKSVGKGMGPICERYYT